MAEVYREYGDSELNRVPPGYYGSDDEYPEWRIEVIVESFQLFNKTEYAIKISVHDDVPNDNDCRLWKSSWTFPINWGSDRETEIRRAIHAFDNEISIMRGEHDQDEEGIA